MASVTDGAERFLQNAGFDRAPWLVVAYGAGIAAWFVLPDRWQWQVLIAGAVALALAAAACPRDGRWPYLRLATLGMALALAAGCATIWAKSTMVGTPAIAHPMVAALRGQVIDRYVMPAEHRIRLTLAAREPDTGRPIRLRLTLPEAQDNPLAVEGAIVQLRARLIPPGPPAVPGAYDAARTAWFDGIAANGMPLGRITVTEAQRDHAWLAALQHALADHVRAQVHGPAGGIAAAFASGDRGGIPATDAAAMRDSGLTHLLSVSGLHVSAVIGGVYVLALRLLALSPWLALRVRLPLMAGVCGAVVGIGYTLLTGAQVPTLRSCAGALLVLAALTLGRQALSVRLLAVAAFAVLLLWPESAISPGFQMSFGAVLAIIAVQDAAPIRAFLAPRGAGWRDRAARGLVMTLLTGLVIELALMPLTFYHFHRAGLYGALANLVAIPLTTFVTMPLIGLALALDLVGLGGPAWWACGRSLDLLLDIARYTAAQPGAVTTLPAMGQGLFAAWVGGMLWLALWHGRVRLLGLVTAVLAAVALCGLRAPDVMIAGDGRNLAIVAGDGGPLVVLGDGRSAYARDLLLESAGETGTSITSPSVTGVRPIGDWGGAQCNTDFCLAHLRRSGRDWRLLVARGRGLPAPADLTRACAKVDIVVTSQQVPGVCRPAFLLADAAVLRRSGGLALDLERPHVTTVAETQGQHPWWPVPGGATRP